VRDALRSLVADPKPEEPQGLGAVVRDRAGVKWVTHDSTPIHQRWINTDDFSERYRTWANIDVVEILSAGWSE